jgi:hypothetical protein
MTVVYWIRHPDHTDIFSQGYVGVSMDAEKRFGQHYKHTQNRHLKFAIQKYGWDNLVKQQVLVADEAYCLDIEQKIRPTNAIGWNCAIGGGKPPPSYGHKRLVGNTLNVGRKHSVEARQKRSDLNRERLQNPIAYEKFAKARVGMEPWNKGKKTSLETIEKIRLSHLGKPSPRKGTAHKQESIDKLKETFRSNPWTCPHCNKIGYNLGSGNRWHFDNCRLKETT